MAWQLTPAARVGIPNAYTKIGQKQGSMLGRLNRWIDTQLSGAVGRPSTATHLDFVYIADGLVELHWRLAGRGLRWASRGPQRLQQIRRGRAGQHATGVPQLNGGSAAVGRLALS